MKGFIRCLVGHTHNECHTAFTFMNNQKRTTSLAYDQISLPVAKLRPVIDRLGPVVNGLTIFNPIT